MNCSLVITFPEQFSRAQTPIVYQVNPPSGVPGKTSPIKIGILMNPFANACCKFLYPGGWSPYMGNSSFFCDAVLKVSVGLWFIFNLVCFRLWALSLYSFTDNERNPNRKREAAKSNQVLPENGGNRSLHCWDFITSHIIATLY